MDRDIVDIPEVFRRAFDEEEGNGGGSGDDGGRGGNGGGSGKAWWSNRWVWISLLGLGLILSINWIISTYTDWLWFSAQSYQSVWLTQWLVRLGSFVVFFAIGAAILLINWRVAFKTARKTRSVSGLFILELPGVSGLVTGSALFLAFIFAGAAATTWERFLLYYFRRPFGVDDPIFNIDLGFYLFELPVYRFLQGWLTPLLIITLLGVVALYLADNWTALRDGQWRPAVRFAPPLRRHVAILGTVILILFALGFVLDIFELSYSPRGVAFGASYTDLNASLPALYAQLALTIVLIVIAAVNIFRSAVRPLLIAGGLWLVVTILAANVYPAVIQRYAVEPNELNRERPFIQNNLDFTRLAFGLDKIDAREFGEVTELTNLELVENRAALQNARLWDNRLLQQTYAQLQELRPYYEFSPVDIDRYEIDGEIRQVMLAGRELNKANLPSPSWINEKLIFTHGYGVVMNPVDQVTPEGRPDFFIKDLPPQSTVPIDVDRPEIYFGENMDDVVFVGSGQEEFDYPLGTQNAQSTYEGDGGITLSSIWRRLAFAIRFGESNLLLSDDIDADTRVLLYRQIRERVRKIAPFLSLDNDPYLVIADGRLFWILDAYTLSRNFPYSTPTEQGFNYIRNSAKITIDAYNGTVNFYLADPDDTIIQAYSDAFPDLFHPLEEMPEELQAHIRYPMDLFSVQTRQYLKYHMTDVQTFYNQEDLWDIPLEVFDANQQQIEPYYVILSLPGEEDTEFLLIEPYTPIGKDNMIAWLAARSDPPHYGELVAYELPKQQLVFGPNQVEARIDQDTEISAQISLWNQRGSRVIRGNLIVMPMGSSFLYVEPLYLLPEATELPELQRVIVASGDRVAMRETLGEAVLALVEQGPTVAESIDEATAADEAAGTDEAAGDVDAAAPEEETATEAVETDAAEPESRPTESAELDPAILELVQTANEHYEAAEEAQRRGDWALYGEELEALQQALQRLIELTEE
jgi:uncharacterized membrane protein (UPF0182 family)